MIDRRYHPPVWGTWPGVLIFLVAAGLFALIWSILNGGPWFFMLLWLAITLSIGVDAIWRTNYQLEFDDTHLFWRGFLRSGTILISEITSVDTEQMGAVAVFKCKNGEKIRVVILQGFAPFLVALNQAHPSIAAAPGAYARLVDRAQLKRKAK